MNDEVACQYSRHAEISTEPAVWEVIFRQSCEHMNRDHMLICDRCWRRRNSAGRVWCRAREHIFESMEQVEQVERISS